MKCFANEVIFPDFVASATGHLYIFKICCYYSKYRYWQGSDWESILSAENSGHCLTMLKPFYKCKNIKWLNNLLSSNDTVLTDKGLSFEKFSSICENRRNYRVYRSPKLETVSWAVAGLISQSIQLKTQVTLARLVRHKSGGCACISVGFWNQSGECASILLLI